MARSPRRAAPAAEAGTTRSGPRKVARVRVLSEDRPGLLHDMTQAIASHGVNVAKAIIRTTKDSKAVNDFDLEVTQLAQLDAVMRSLEGVKGVLEVRRG
ncbi:MAG: ACT domain-containing protein [Candidatus Methylomirabilis sp.]|nr:ACT domain-containing protein [Deltaproteobacteria bacterium]